MNVRKLRANLAAVLDRAAAGETVEITRDGAPVAVVGPVPDDKATWGTTLAEPAPILPGHHRDAEVLGRVASLTPTTTGLCVVVEMGDGPGSATHADLMHRASVSLIELVAVLTISDADPLPAGQWCRRESDGLDTADIFECSGATSGLTAGAYATHWCIGRIGTHYGHVENAGSFAANLLAADAAYRKAIAERDGGAA